MSGARMRGPAPDPQDAMPFIEIGFEGCKSLFGGTCCKSSSAVEDVTNLHACRHIQQAANNVFPQAGLVIEVAADLSEAPSRMPKVR